MIKTSSIPIRYVATQHEGQWVVLDGDPPSSGTEVAVYRHLQQNEHWTELEDGVFAVIEARIGPKAYAHQPVWFRYFIDVQGTRPVAGREEFRRYDLVEGWDEVMVLAHGWVTEAYEHCGMERPVPLPDEGSDQQGGLL